MVYGNFWIEENMKNIFSFIIIISIIVSLILAITGIKSRNKYEK